MKIAKSILQYLGMLILCYLTEILLVCGPFWWLWNDTFAPLFSAPVLSFLEAYKLLVLATVVLVILDPDKFYKVTRYDQ